MTENMIIATSYKYTVATGILEVVDSMTSIDANLASIEASYADSTKFITDYKSGELNFVEQSTATPDDIFKKIENLKKVTNVELLLQSAFMAQPDVNAPVGEGFPGIMQGAPKNEPAVELPKLPGDSVRMKKNGDVDMIHVTKFDEAVANGWVPTKKEYRDYPIVLDPTTNKIRFTCFEHETPKFVAEGMVILKFQK